MACFPKARKDGLAAEFSRASEKRTVCVCMALYAALSCGWLLYFGAWEGLGCIGAALLTFLSYYRTAVREFGGMTGDLAGWFLQRCERNTAVFLAFCSLAGLFIGLKQGYCRLRFRVPCLRWYSKQSCPLFVQSWSDFLYMPLPLLQRSFPKVQHGKRSGVL